MGTATTRHQAADRGFTLVEIVIAIVLVGILSAVVVVGIGRLTSQGTSAACTASQDAARAATTVYHGTNLAFPTSFTQLTTATPPVLSLPDGASVSANGLAVSTSGWTLTLIPGTAGGPPTFVCSTEIPQGFTLGPNGHAYAFVAAPGITHAAAITAAATYTAGDQVGHLATITDAAEHNLIFSLVGNRSAWLGGSDTAVEGTWRWVVGPEAGTTFSNGAASVGGSYVNWAIGMPDNWDGDDARPNWGPENCLHMWVERPNRWNDIPCNWDEGDGYVVEISF